MTLPGWLLAQASPSLLLLAQEESGGGSYGVAWLLVLMAIGLGVWVTVTPDKREEDVKRHKA